MIDFNDVRRTQEQTFFFFPNGMAQEFTYFLRQAGIPEQDAQILNYSQIKNTYPDMTIPEIPIDPTLKGIPAAICLRPCLLVSHMDTDDLQDKLWSIHGSEDAMNWRKAQVQEAMDTIDRENEELDNWEPGLTRKDETV